MDKICIQNFPFRVTGKKLSTFSEYNSLMSEIVDLANYQVKLSGFFN